MNEINAQSVAQEARTESSADRAANYSGGIAEQRGLLNRPDNYSQNLGGGDAAMSQAIRSKYAGQFERSAERLSLRNLKNANQDHLKKLEIATAMANEEHKMNFEKEMQRKKMAQARSAMRGQLVGSILGIVGGVAGGFATAGNPAGIMAGASLGQGAGQAIGGA